MKSKITHYLSLFVIISIISLATIVFLFIIFNKTSITATQSYLMIGSVIVSLIVLFFLSRYFKPNIIMDIEDNDKENKINKKNDRVNDWNKNIKENYSFTYKSKLSIQLLIGTSTSIEKLAPNLTTDIWQENNGTLLIYGGDIHQSIDENLIQDLKQLRRRRPLDAVIWVSENNLSQQPLGHSLFNHLNPTNTDTASRYFHQLFRQLHWQAPIWLWNISNNGEITTNEAPTVLYSAPLKATSEILSNDLKMLLPALVEQGTQAVLHNPTQTYLLALARFLQHEGCEKLANNLAPLLSGYRSLPFAGVLFSTAVNNNVSATSSQNNQWISNSHWKALITANSQLPYQLKASPLGLNSKRILQYTIATTMTLWGIGMVVSYFMNRQLISQSQQQAQLATDNHQSEFARLQAQYGLQQTLGLLSHREKTSVPFWLRFGLSSNNALLSHLWPVYSQSMLPLLRDSTQQHLENYLHTFMQFPPDSAERIEGAQSAYQALKAYLMMGDPSRIDPAFFTESALHIWPDYNGLKEGEWQTLGTELLTFYASQLPYHHEWTIKPNRTLVAGSRTILIRQIGQRNGESALYQKILQQAQHNFADMTLDDMTGDTDVSFLLSSADTVPGIFTRKAWEESVEPAIKKAVHERREEIDWVLSDTQKEADIDISPEKFQQNLTERYFNDFSGSWLSFLNGLQWRETQSLSDTIDQLTLMSDVRQSPIIALMNTLSYQGKTGRQQEKLTDSFVNSAKDLLNKEQQPVISQKAEFTGPLEPVFAPILAFTDPQSSAQNSDALSLQAYLTRVTRVRLKLQQVVNAPDPQAMSQALARSVFEGKTVDLSETRDYGSLIAASFGQEWNSFGDTLLAQPLSQAWQQLLAPTSQGINTQWRNAVVNDWNRAFGGRYPLKNTQSEISLPLMAQYLRPDNGRIQRFLETHLNGVLHKEGTHWVPDTTNAQGLTFNPEFLKALDKLSYLGDVVFANGEARLYFELRPGTSPDIMQTHLMIDKQSLIYDNQQPQWQRFVWPADTVASGASLSWITTNTGTRIYGDYRGVWGIIRLLEDAKIAPYAGSTSSYSVSWKTLNGQSLNYTLRTEMGEGPIALLQLRNFVLPEKIFLD
ncbi:ImcF-related family protein [Proteus terrae]|uniref:ImcF-related family protein n=1 Tax=Proteus terrae TaxID=1574161 RepID=UPI001330B11A|nr:ImcF-related family protein [Proteus terrae]QKD68620.1 type VI secretion protein VasK [Proteus terrae subsp. cibarius]QKD73794.1 type VI secretion protein VasK [Proteus terrae subsp. cibarius]UDF25102.1 type VI secretion protein VasK [Proteus terrae subsp. cibarius]WCG85876.1 ImcF-related family protein [Proteus terrae]